MKKLSIFALSMLASTAWLACSDDDSGSSQPAVDASTPIDGATPVEDSAAPIDSGSDAGDAGNDSGSTTIGAGPYSIAYSAAPGAGIDQRTPVTAVVSANGELDSYDAGAMEAPTRNTAEDAEHFVDAFSQIGRWTNGTTAGKFYAVTGFPFTPTQGFHHAMVVTPASVPTSGTVSYTFLKGTSVTNEDGSAMLGTSTATGAVLFGASGRKTGLELTITIPGDATYTATTPGGSADPSQSALGSFGVSTFFGDIPVTSTGAACSGPAACTMTVRGYLGGGPNGTARMAMVFVLSSGGTAKALRGAALLKAP